jgi:benzoyl-CoA-dihydrodiol lyase
VEEGVKGQRALEWGLVDELVPRSKLEEAVRKRAAERAARSDRPADARGIALTPLHRTLEDDRIAYHHVECRIDRERGRAEITVKGPTGDPPAGARAIHDQGDRFWPLALARELDDLILHLRVNEEAIGVWVLRTEGSTDRVEAHDRLLAAHAGDWLVREIRLYLRRTLKRLDASSRSLIALIEPGSCFAGTLLELALAADRSYMLDGTRDGDDRPPATLRLTELNFGAYPMPHGLTRLQGRFLGEPARVEELKAQVGKDLDAAAADDAGLVTFTPDDIDWDDEVRMALEERAALSPDALTGMEASLRFAGPETVESKIFGRLSAWQNWIFQRPNAVGEKGALRVYGTGQRPEYDRRRA